MNRLRRILLITALESLGTVLLERGIHFYTHEHLGFSSQTNLWLAMVFGITYVIGALISHPIAHRLGEKRLLQLTLILSFLVHFGLSIWVSAPIIFIAITLLGLMNGLKWPVVESYVGAGRTGRDQAKAVGLFNIAWASTVPLSLLLAGPLIAFFPAGLFWTPTLINAVAFCLVLALPAAPSHLDIDHPHRPEPAVLQKSKGLLFSARWSMLASYSLLFVASPLLPEMYARLGVAVVLATALSGLLDVCRLTAFAVLRQWHGWHGRIWPVAAVVALLPFGFAIMLFAPELSALLQNTTPAATDTPASAPDYLGVTLAILGSIIFGLACGVTYYAALYYGLLVKNASVDAGGAHEGLIGAGFALGPAAGLLGTAILPATPVAFASLLGLGPVVIVCILGATHAARRSHTTTQDNE